MRRYIKKIIIFLLCILFILLFSCLSYLIDSKRVDNNKRPVFTIQTQNLNDGGTTIYYGIGYSIIRWHKVNINTRTNISYLVGIEKHFLLGINNWKDGPGITLEEKEN